MRRIESFLLHHMFTNQRVMWEIAFEKILEYVENDRPDVDTDNFLVLGENGNTSPQYINRILKETTKELRWDKHITAHDLCPSMAKGYDHSSWKSLGMFMRRRDYVWNSEENIYELEVTSNSIGSLYSEKLNIGDSEMSKISDFIINRNMEAGKILEKI